MARNYHKDEYKVKNPGKYVGGTTPIYRSSWELTMFTVLDEHPAVLNWASESIKIPYIHPLTKKWTIYVPDLLVTYVDAQMQQHSEIIEIKPLGQTVLEKARGKYDKLAVIINQAKWNSARLWCARNGFTFRVLTEKDLFR